MDSVNTCPRTLLFVPGSKPKVIAKAAGLTADAVIIDLEDAVAPDAKCDARQHVADALRALDFGGKLRAVRINALDSAHAAADAGMAATAEVDALVVPKMSSVADIDGEPLAAPRVSDMPLWVMIETPQGVLNAASIAAHPRVQALIVGTNDLALGLGCEAGGSRAPMQTALQMAVLAARAAGVHVYDGVYNDFSAPEGLRAECEEGKALGFDGKTLIHPSQIDIAAGVFRPSDAEVEEARALIAAFAASGGGAVNFRGRMIEDLHVTAAKRLLGEG